MKPNVPDYIKVKGEHTMNMSLEGDLLVLRFPHPILDWGITKEQAIKFAEAILQAVGAVQ